MDSVAELLGKSKGRLATGGTGDDESKEVRVDGASVVHALDAGKTAGKYGESTCEEDVTSPWVVKGLTAFQEWGWEVEEDLVVEERGG